MSISPPRCVLAVFAHPDDEAYAAGGTLALSAQQGARVVVVAATRGEAGADRRRRVPSGPQLAALRSEELAHSCRALGAEPPRFLDLPDGAVDAQRGAPLLARLLDAIAPDVVLTLGPDGAYGHPDHLATTAMLAEVAEVAGARRVLHAAFPRGLFDRARRRIARVTPLADVGPLGIDRAAADLVVDVRAVAGAKLAALAAHRSQLAAADPRTFLDFGLVDHLLEEEWFVHAAGPPLPARASTIFDGLPPNRAP